MEQDTEYTISIIGGGNSAFDFTVEQDNWVYAPDGGIWEADTNYFPVWGTEYYPTSDCYINKTKLGIPGTVSDVIYQDVQELCGGENYDN